MLVKPGELPQILESLGLAQYRDAIVAAARPAIAVHRDFMDDDDLAVGSSKFGGDPDLLPATPWPGDLALIAQFNLSDLWRYTAAAVLPRRGLLSFFYDIYDQPWGFPKDRGGWKVVYEENIAALERRKSPPPPEGYEYAVALARRYDPSLPAKYDDYHVAPRRVWFTEFESFRDHSYFWTPLERGIRFEDLWNAERAGFAVDAQDVPGLTELYELPFDPTCQLFGHETVIQNPMEDACEWSWFNSAAPPGQKLPPGVIPQDRLAAWHLLFQVYSGGELEFGDGGMIYYWARDEWIAERRFDEVWLQLQCH